MGGPSWRGAAPGGARSSRSARRGRSIPEFPKSVRLLRSKDFRRVYDQGARFSGPLFTAFCERHQEAAGPRVGFTVPRALGNAVVRNRIKRRVREAVRLQLDELSPHWSIVINPRRTARSAPFPELEREVRRLLLRCNAS